MNPDRPPQPKIRHFTLDPLHPIGDANVPRSASTDDEDAGRIKALHDAHTGVRGWTDRRHHEQRASEQAQKEPSE